MREITRWWLIIFAYQFNDEQIRILLAVLASGYHQFDVLVAFMSQRAMLREVRFSGLVLEQTKWNSSKRRFFNLAAAAKSECDEGEAKDDTSTDPNKTQVDTPGFPYQPNPLLVIMYGQSYTSY